MTDLVIAAYQVARGMEFLASRLVSKHCARFPLNTYSNSTIGFATRLSDLARSLFSSFVVFVMYKFIECSLPFFIIMIVIL